MEVPAQRTRGAGRRRLGLLVAVVLLQAGCVGTTRAPGGASPPSAPASSNGAPSAPPGLVGKPWLAATARGSWVVGVVGSDARLALTAGELPVASADGLVASAAIRSDQTGSTVRVREIASGRLLAEIDRPGNVSSAVFVGDRLIVAGHDPMPAGDPGVASISLADGSVSTLVEPGPLPAGWVGSAARSLVISRSGRTVVSGLCLAGRCAIDVIDTAGGLTQRIVDEVDAFPALATDDVLIAGPDDGSSLEALDLATGRETWRREEAEFQYSYLTSDGRLVLSYIDHREPWSFVVSVIDPQTNDERVVLRRDPGDGLTLWPGLSGDDLAVLGTGGRFEDVSTAAPTVRASLLDLATGRLVPGGISIPVTDH
jgi:hypothetical protein